MHGQICGSRDMTVAARERQVERLLRKVVDLRRKRAPLVEVSAREGGTGTPPDSADILAELHSKFFVVVRAGRTMIAYEEEDPALKRRVIRFMRKPDLQLRYAPDRVQVGTKDGTPILKPAADVWMQSPERRAYDRMALLPGGSTDADTFNLWRGWAVEPAEGDCSLIREHLTEVICDGDTARFDYLLRWMAFCVQHPAERPEVAIVLRGGEGAGKAAGVAPLARIFRHHYLHLTDPRHLTGHFNAHLIDACLVFADETFCAGDRRPRHDCGRSSPRRRT